MKNGQISYYSVTIHPDSLVNTLSTTAMKCSIVIQIVRMSVMTDCHGKNCNVSHLTYTCIHAMYCMHS